VETALIVIWDLLCPCRTWPGRLIRLAAEVRRGLRSAGSGPEAGNAPVR